MKKLLILHSWFGTPKDNWNEYLKANAINKGYEVFIPLLVNNEKPTLSDWISSALMSFQLNSDTSIVGHSLGAVLAMKLVQNSLIKIDHLILVAGWDFWDLTLEHKTFFDAPIDHAKIASNAAKITVMTSTNDPYTTLYHAKEMAKRLGADIVTIENGGHLQAKDGFEEFPVLAEVLE
jgi:predicted alpha/beta hydrolase family esterase